MNRSVRELACFAVAISITAPAMAHDCRVLDRYLRGTYEGDCDGRHEFAQGRGEAKGAATYVGDFVKGKVDGKGVYTWEDGARLEGSFKDGKANGTGVFVSAKGVRYEGQFENGRFEGLKASDCPSAPGPINC